MTDDVSFAEYGDMRLKHAERTAPESAVSVLEVRDDAVLLDLPDSIRDCDRVIPEDFIEFGDDARAWFAWDMEKKVPRAPHTATREFGSPGYAGRVKWGRESVAQNQRPGGTYHDVMSALDHNKRAGCVRESWTWHTDDDGARPLYPMMIMPHSDFSPDPGVVFFDFDDVIERRGDGVGVLTREAWDIICELDAYAEVSTSMTGVHVFVRGRLPDFAGSKAEIRLDTGKVEVWGYPQDGRVMGTTWAHIGDTPRALPERCDTVSALLDAEMTDDDKLSADDMGGGQRTVDVDFSDTDTGTSSSPYLSVPVLRVANTPPFSTHRNARNRGPHPEHGGTTTPDSESTNFSVNTSENCWHCFAHESGGGALHLIAAMEGVRECRHASDLFDDSHDVFKACIAARDKYCLVIDDADPPTAALKGAMIDVGLSAPSGRLDEDTCQLARQLFDESSWGDVA